MGKMATKRSGHQKPRNQKYMTNTFEVSPTMKGFLVTCTRGRERNSAMEIIDLLEDYAARLYPNLEDDIATDTATATATATAGEEGDSIEDEIARELANMKSKGKTKLFRYLSTTIECMVYIKCHTRIDPNKLVQFIFDDLVETKQRRTRYTSRLIPAQITTTAKLDAIARDSLKVVQHLLTDDVPSSTFALVVHIRCCDSDLKRQDIIEAVAAPLDTKHKVDLKNAKYTLVIEAFKSMCTIGLVEDYNARKRLNLTTLFDEQK